MNYELTRNWYNQVYGTGGPASQRRYPNEELLRFMGRNYFPLSAEERAKTRILEIGCGSGANLWMIAHEGFQTCGLDLSEEATRQAGIRLGSWQVTAELKTASMTAIPWEDGSFDAVVDVFSSTCLPEKDFTLCLAEVSRVLRPGGVFFIYTPSKRSDVFLWPSPSKMLDASTLAGVTRQGPFCGDDYPFRFIHPEDLATQLNANGFDARYLETTGRTYCRGQEYFEFVVAEAVKRPENTNSNILPLKTLQNINLTGERIYLRPLVPGDATLTYVNWLNDPVTTRYLESGGTTQTVDSVAAYIEQFQNRSDTLFLAIVLKETHVHVGNIKLEPIDWRHRHAVLGIMIGSAEHRGKGFGSEAMLLLLRYGFNILKLHRISLGVAADNLDAIKLYRNLGFKDEGLAREIVLREHGFVDRLSMAILEDEFRQRYGA